MNESDKKKAQVILERMCKKLLANPVIEDYHIEIDKIE
jgi:phosphoribosylformylglycinamidine synthase PurS subunit